MLLHQMEQQQQGLQALSENGGGKAISEAIKQAAQRSKLMSQQIV